MTAKLSFKPVSSKRLTIEASFTRAMKVADRVTMTETPRTVVFKLRKRKASRR